jgi:hypothetical protein
VNTRGQRGRGSPCGGWQKNRRAAFEPFLSNHHLIFYNGFLPPNRYPSRSFLSLYTSQTLSPLAQAYRPLSCPSPITFARSFLPLSFVPSQSSSAPKLSRAYAAKAQTLKERLTELIPKEIENVRPLPP